MAAHLFVHGAFLEKGGLCHTASKETPPPAPPSSDHVPKGLKAQNRLKPENLWVKCTDDPFLSLRGRRLRTKRDQRKHRLKENKLILLIHFGFDWSLQTGLSCRSLACSVNVLRPPLCFSFSAPFILSAGGSYSFVDLQLEMLKKSHLTAAFESLLKVFSFLIWPSSSSISAEKQADLWVTIYRSSPKNVNDDSVHTCDFETSYA